MLCCVTSCCILIAGINHDIYKTSEVMTMTKKHFIALADHIKNNDVTFDSYAIESLAEYCKDMNPRFNKERWLDYIAGKCGKNGGAVKKAVNA